MTKNAKQIDAETVEFTEVKNQNEALENSVELVVIGKKELSGLNAYDAKIDKIIKSNPFIEVTDKKTADIARDRAANLRNARLELRSTGKGETQETIIKEKIKELSKFVVGKIDNYVSKLSDPETKLKAEIDAYDAKVAADKAAEAERLRLEEEARKKKITDAIDGVDLLFSGVIDSVKTFEDIPGKAELFHKIYEKFESDNLENEFDLAEFQEDYERIKIENAEDLDKIIKVLTADNAAKLAEKAAKVAELKVSRMEQLFDYDFKYKGEKSLGEMEADEYTEVLTGAILQFRGKEAEAIGMELSNEGDAYTFAIDGSEVINLACDEICNLSDESWDTLKVEISEEIKLQLEPQTPAETIEETIESEEISNIDAAKIDEITVVESENLSEPTKQPEPVKKEPDPAKITVNEKESAKEIFVPADSVIVAKGTPEVIAMYRALKTLLILHKDNDVLSGIPKIAWDNSEAALLNYEKSCKI